MFAVTSIIAWEHILCTLYSLPDAKNRHIVSSVYHGHTIRVTLSVGHSTTYYRVRARLHQASESVCIKDTVTTMESIQNGLRPHWWLVRVTCFCPKILGPWWGPTKAFCGCVNGHWVGTVLPGGGDT